MKTPIPTTSIEGFKQWLPGELRYSAEKAPYPRKIQRASMPAENPDSMYGFISEEWHAFQLQKKNGAYYMPFHGKSAQQQLAKFSAGFFDKYALATWMQDTVKSTMNAMDRAAAITAGFLLDTNPWEDVRVDTETLLELPFEDTPFAEGLIKIMRGIVTAEASPESERIEHAETFKSVALDMGALAARCYVTYADTYLSTDQFAIPPSQHAA